VLLIWLPSQLPPSHLSSIGHTETSVQVRVSEPFASVATIMIPLSRILEVLSIQGSIHNYMEFISEKERILLCPTFLPNNPSCVYKY